MAAFQQYVEEQLPLTEAVLQQMKRRANLVVLVWKSCDTPARHYTAGNNMGVDCSLFQPHCHLHPKAVLQLIKCGCKGTCNTMSCTCKKHNLRCTDMCGSCKVKCTNRNRDTDAVEHVTRDMNDEEDLYI